MNVTGAGKLVYFTKTAAPYTYTLSLHDALPILVISKGRALATGPPDELRRARPVVRFRVSGLAPGWWQPLANGARWKDEGGDWLLAEDLDPARIPDVVAGAVALGGRVEAVVPEQQSLEASFL